jgi:hypothetical protein
VQKWKTVRADIAGSAKFHIGEVCSLAFEHGSDSYITQFASLLGIAVISLQYPALVGRSRVAPVSM